MKSITCEGDEIFAIRIVRIAASARRLRDRTGMKGRLTHEKYRINKN